MYNMAYFIVLLLFCVKYSIGYSFMDEWEVPIWPGDYHIKAEKINMAAGILENMEFWSSTTYNRSRVDFYDGLVKKFYHWKTEDEPAYVYSFMPTWTEEYQNEILCGLQFLEDDEVENCLPEVKDFKRTGKQELEGKEVDFWKYEKIYKEKRWMEKTLYTYRVHDYDVPVRFEVKNYLIRNGATTAHTVMNYFSFEPTTEEDDFDEGDTGNVETISKHLLDTLYDCEFVGTLGEDFSTDIKHLHPAKYSDVNAAFHGYKKHHSKTYDNEDEHELRKAIFHETWAMIEHHNRQNLGYKLELNQFADRSYDEMSLFTGLLPSPPIEGTHPFPHSDEEVKILAEELPESYDMRMEGIISAVKNQAQCGSCWAFASTAAVEGAVARSNGGRIVDLSEQSLVDCAWGWSCMGCDGGLTEEAFHYIVKHGIPMEDEYGSYLEQDGLCHTENMTSTYHIKGFAKPTHHNPQALKVALHKYGPVVVSIHFNEKMRFYSNGVFFDPDCNKGHRNHAVVVVGYGVRDGVDYWILRNSHGYAWGQAGYILVSAQDNNCFVLDDPVYPIV